jgi:2-dehydro-3-deoxygluconokinase
MNEETKHADSIPELALRPAGQCRWDLLSLGEVMLRFDPGEGRIVGARSFRVWEGGGEYNVARGLRRCFEQRTAIVTALVDNPIGRLVEDLILQGGVDTSHILWHDFDGIGNASRNGIYFLERGFGVRPGTGVMDRGHTAISQLAPGQVDWDTIFGTDGARWFHTGGIMAALSESATEVVREAMTAARRHGTVVSFDCNYRASLWRTRGGRQGAAAVNRSLAPLVDVLFGHEGDLAATVGQHSHGPAWHTLLSFTEMAGRMSAEFPNLKVIASTVRDPRSASRNGWGGFAFAQGQAYEGIHFSELDILDRVGGGDSFASGLIYGLLHDKGLKWSLDCGIAHGALAMTTPGDASMVRIHEVEALMSGSQRNTIR